jgi:mRNA interferase HigB
MQIIDLAQLREFCKKHNQARKPVEAWHKIVESADWSKFADIQASLPKTDKVGDCYVFDLGGNKYRLVAKIKFDTKQLVVRKLMTHAEYDKTDWQKTCGCKKASRKSH